MWPAVRTLLPSLAWYANVLWDLLVAPKFAYPLHTVHVFGQSLLDVLVPSRLAALGAFTIRSVHVSPRVGCSLGQERLAARNTAAALEMPLAGWCLAFVPYCLATSVTLVFLQHAVCASSPPPSLQLMSDFKNLSVDRHRLPIKGENACALTRVCKAGVSTKCTVTDGSCKVDVRGVPLLEGLVCGFGVWFSVQ